MRDADGAWVPSRNRETNTEEPFCHPRIKSAPWPPLVLRGPDGTSQVLASLAYGSATRRLPPIPDAPPLTVC